MFGKAYTSHAPSATRRSLEVPSLLTAFGLRSSFLRDLGNGGSFYQNNMPFVASDSSRVLI